MRISRYGARKEGMQQPSEAASSAAEQPRSLNELRDYGGRPLVFNIERLTDDNDNFRTAIWTGQHMQITLMNIPSGGEIGLEIHPDLDQLLRIESGTARVFMGRQRGNMTLRANVDPRYAIVIPAGTWHNLVNAGDTPLKLYSVYAPPAHPFGTLHKAKVDSDSAEH